MEAEVQPKRDEVETLRELVASLFGGRVRGFRVLAREDGLVLQGRVASYHLKQCVQEAVFRATESRVVANEIAVD